MSETKVSKSADEMTARREFLAKASAAAFTAPAVALLLAASAKPAAAQYGPGKEKGNGNGKGTGTAGPGGSAQARLFISFLLRAHAGHMPSHRLLGHGFMRPDRNLPAVFLFL